MKWFYIVIPLCCILIASLFLIASQIKPQKPKPIPLLSVSELLDLKENYTDEYINVSGFLEYKQVVRWTILLPHVYFTYDSDGNMITHIGLQSIEKELYLYHLHANTSESSSYINLIEEYSGLYLPVFPLPFWYSPSWGHAKAEPDIIFPEIGYAYGIWKYRDVRDHGKMWCLEV